MRSILYNEQRNNASFDGLFPGSCQCFSTSDWMNLSFVIPTIKGDDDKGLSVFVDDVCNKVGQPGIAEAVAKKFGLDPNENMAYEWCVQQAGMQEWLNEAGIDATVELYVDLKTGKGLLTWEKLTELLKLGPVTIGTYKLGGLGGGHIILAVDLKEDGTIGVFHDPFGDAKTGYKNQNGAYVEYTKEFLESHVMYNGGIRGMFIRLKK